MLTIRLGLMVSAIALLALVSPASDAKRLGAKSAPPSSSSSGPPVAKVEPKSGQQAGGSGALGYGAGAAVGVAAGHATAKAMKRSDNEEIDKHGPSTDPELTAAQRRIDKLTDLERKAQTEEIVGKAEQFRKDSEARTKADTARGQAEEKRRQDEINARLAAAEQERAERKRQALARELSCVIKPVMSDAEIKHCRWAWNSPPL